jgi:hypothetical protein
MTYAESICSQIARRSTDLASLSDALARSSVLDAPSDEWSAREILLHLIGASSVIPEHIALAVANDNLPLASNQRGGAYLDVAGIDTASGAAAVLQQRLAAIASAVDGLDDETMRRLVTITPSEGEPIPNVPIGLVVRHAVTEHFDEHMAQLREVLSATTERPRN